MNAQRLLDDEGEEQIEIGHEEDHPHDEENSEHSNSWGGSQYDPEAEFDNVEFADQDEPQDDPEGEDNEVRMSTMRAVRMHAMRRITEPGENIPRDNTFTLSTPSRIVETLIDSDETSGAASGEGSTNPSPPQASEGQPSVNTIHSHMYGNAGDAITDPVFIEYRDGLVYRRELTDNFDLFNEALRRMTCRLCNSCHPVVRQEHFTGSDNVEYYYNIFTCRRPVERRLAEEEIDAEESEFDVRRFFAIRIDSTSEESDNDSDSDSYSSMPALMDVEIEEVPGEPNDRDIDYYTDIPDGGFQCNDCHNCTPRVVAVYRHGPTGTRFHRYRIACVNHTLTDNRRLTNGILQPHEESHDPGSEGLPDLERINEGSEEDNPRNHTIEFEVDALSNGLTGLGPEAHEALRSEPEMVRRLENAMERLHEDDPFLEDEDVHHHGHHHEPIECPYCHECEPTIEQVFYGGSDGEMFSRDRIICHAPETLTLRAMRTVYSSTVRRKVPLGSEQPKRTRRLQATLAAEVEINGIRALALFDSGSTTDSITPEFAFASKAKQIRLEEQVILQLGCVGSRSKISYGTKVPIDLCEIKDDVYFDLVNIDRYDCIIGTPFMNTYGVCLDFGTRTIRVNGKEIKAFSFDEEQAYVDKKHRKSGGRKPPPRETAPIRAKKIVTSLPVTSSN
jgi:hypothetical protein